MVTPSPHFLEATSDEEADLFELQAIPPTWKYLKAMWRKRAFIFALPIEQLRVSHQTTLLGNIWHLANPALSVVVYYIVFDILLNASRGVDNYLVFLVVGVFVYNFSSACFVGGARSITRGTGLMRSFRFPRAGLPVSDVFGVLLTFSFQFVTVLGLAIATGEVPTFRWLLLPMIICAQFFFNTGGALITARLNDSFRDVEQIIPFIMRLGIYGSGVMFPIRERAASAPPVIREIITWNPFLGFLDIYRWSILGSDVTHEALISASVATVVLLTFGFRFFVNAEPRYGRG